MVLGREAGAGGNLDLGHGSEHGAVVRLDGRAAGEGEVPRGHLEHDVVGIERHDGGGVARLVADMGLDHGEVAGDRVHREILSSDHLTIYGQND